MVYLYAVLEHCVNRCVRQLSELINDYDVRTKDVTPALMCLVHDPHVNSVANGGKKGKVQKRSKLFNAIFSPDKANIHAEFLNAELQNVWAKSLDDVFLAFGLASSPLSQPANRSRIDRLVNDRNAVAHGRMTPDAVGSNYSTTDVDEIINCASLETSHFIESLAAYYENREFISPTHRNRYIKRDK